MSKKYKHTYWLKIEDDTIEKVWINLKEYKEKHKCNMEVFYRETNFINKIIKLECNQSYQDLDLDVNSLSGGSLTRLLNKPKNICAYKKNIEDFFKINIKKSTTKTPKEIKSGIYEIIPIHTVEEARGEIYTEYMNFNSNNGTIIYEKRMGHLLPSPEIIKISEYQIMINNNGVDNISGAKEFKKFIHKYPEIYITAIENEVRVHNETEEEQENQV